MTTKIIIFFFFHLICNADSNYLSKGSFLSVEDASSNFLISPSKTFTCGFYTFNKNTHAYYFSIWFTNSKEKNIVWTANQEKPVNSRGSRLTLSKHGALILTDFDRSFVWITNTSSNPVDRVELLDSGNLVLKDPRGNVLWQSFDFLTDTLLPNQIFTKNQKLVSRTSPEVLSSGYFSLFFDDHVLNMVYDGPEMSSIYWPNPDNDIYQDGRTTYNSTRVAILDDNGTFFSSDRLKFSSSDMGFGVNRRLTIDYDGNLRLYSLSTSSRLWIVTWQAISEPCRVHGLCGRNRICVNSPKPKYSCPPHYEPTSLSDWIKGCKPMFKHSCRNSQFLEIPHADYYGFDLTYNQNISFEDCQKLCLGDCHCHAFKHSIRSDHLFC